MEPKDLNFHVAPEPRERIDYISIFDMQNHDLLKSIVEINFGENAICFYSDLIAYDMIRQYEKQSSIEMHDHEIEKAKQILEPKIKAYLSEFEKKAALPELLKVTPWEEIMKINVISEPRNKSVIIDTVRIDDINWRKDFVLRGAQNKAMGVKMLYEELQSKFDKLFIVGIHEIDCIERVYEAIEECGDFTIIN